MNYHANLVFSLFLNTKFTTKSFSSISLWDMLWQFRLIFKSNCRLEESEREYHWNLTHHIILYLVYLSWHHIFHQIPLLRLFVKNAVKHSWLLYLPSGHSVEVQPYYIENRKPYHITYNRIHNKIAAILIHTFFYVLYIVYNNNIQNENVNYLYLQCLSIISNSCSNNYV